jgi:hypothetical protein
MQCCITIVDHWTMQENDHGLYNRQMKDQKQQQQQMQFNNQYEKRPVSLVDISPKWAVRLKEKRSLLFLISLRRLRWLFQILHPKKCIVAEAYGFSSSYAINCVECARMGNKFSLYFTLCLSNEFEQNLQRFVKHWNEKHVN